MQWIMHNFPTYCRSSDICNARTTRNTKRPGRKAKEMPKFRERASWKSMKSLINNSVWRIYTKENSTRRAMANNEIKSREITFKQNGKSETKITRPSLRTSADARTGSRVRRATRRIICGTIEHEI